MVFHGALLVAALVDLVQLSLYPLHGGPASLVDGVDVQSDQVVTGHGGLRRVVLVRRVHKTYCSSSKISVNTSFNKTLKKVARL